MLKLFKNKLACKKGQGYIDVVLIVLAAMLVIALAIKVYPAFILKDQLNTLANQILRESQLQGKIEIEYLEMAKTMGIIPDEVIWEANTFESNKVQFNEDITVTCKANAEIGLFDSFGSFSIPLKGKATGKSEVYWKDGN
jgi:hypothetical protein